MFQKQSSSGSGLSSLWDHTLSWGNSTSALSHRLIYNHREKTLLGAIGEGKGDAQGLLMSFLSLPTRALGQKGKLKVESTRTKSQGVQDGRVSGAQC